MNQPPGVESAAAPLARAPRRRTRVVHCAADFQRTSADHRSVAAVNLDARGATMRAIRRRARCATGGRQDAIAHQPAVSSPALRTERSRGGRAGAAVRRRQPGRPAADHGHVLAADECSERRRRQPSPARSPDRRRSARAGRSTAPPSAGAVAGCGRPARVVADAPGDRREGAVAPARPGAVRHRRCAPGRSRWRSRRPPGRPGGDEGATMWRGVAARQVPV